MLQLILLVLFITLFDSASSQIKAATTRRSSAGHMQCQTVLFDSSLSFLQSVNLLRESMIGRRSSIGAAPTAASKLQSTLKTLEDEIEFGVDRFGFDKDVMTRLKISESSKTKNSKRLQEATTDHHECHRNLLKLAQVVQKTLNNNHDEDGENNNNGHGENPLFPSSSSSGSTSRFSVVSPAREEYGPSEPARSVSARIYNLKRKNKGNKKKSSVVIPDLDSWIGDDHDVIEEALNFWS